MKKPKRVLALLLGLCLVSALVVLTAAAGDDTPLLPGITVKDPYPQGCVDCHIAGAQGKDTRLNAVLARVKDHPDVARIVRTAPKDCLTCHKEGSKIPPLGSFIHKAHYNKPAANEFVTVYKGACLNCHAFDPTTGGMVEKSGPKNW